MLMCGIFGYISANSDVKSDFQTARTILKGLQALEYRGYDSWGIAVPVKNGIGHDIKRERHTGKIGDARTNLASSLNSGIGHTRWATHGGVTDDNAHPHVDCTNSYAVVHNGIVENYQELKDWLAEKGHTCSSDTDTEIVVHLYEELRKSLSPDKALSGVFDAVEGLNAVAVYDTKEDCIVAGRNGSPLVFGVAEQTHYVGSDVTAFLPHTKNVIFPEDGQGALLYRDKLQIFDMKTGKPAKHRLETVDWDHEEATKNGYPHYLLKEIFEQSSTIPKTAHINTAEIRKAAQLCRKSRRIVLTGCGTAAFCAAASQYFFANAGLQAEVHPANEIDPFIKAIGPDDTIIAISQSGETADTVQAVQKARKKGTSVICLVNARGSTLERMSDVVLSVGAGPEIAVVSTKAFTAQLSIMHRIVSEITHEAGRSQAIVEETGKLLKDWLASSSVKRIKRLAKELSDTEHVFVLGKHMLYPAAMEFALKIKETSYVHAESFASGELKHGVIALIERGTPCVFLIQNDDVRKEVVSSAQEVKARGGRIIGVSPDNADIFDVHIPVPDLGDLTIISMVITGQLLGYYIAMQKGLDPDKPRNLAKSVTVK